MKRVVFSSSKNSFYPPTKPVARPLTARKVSTSPKTRKLSLNGTRVYPIQLKVKKENSARTLHKKVESEFNNSQNYTKKSYKKAGPNFFASFSGSLNPEENHGTEEIPTEKSVKIKYKEPQENRKSIFVNVPKLNDQDLEEDLVRAAKIICEQRTKQDIITDKKYIKLEEYKKLSQKEPKNRVKQNETVLLSILSNSLKTHQERGFIINHQSPIQTKMVPLINSMISNSQEKVQNMPGEEKLHAYHHELFKPTPLFSCAEFIKRKQMREEIINQIGSTLNENNKKYFDLLEESRMEILKNNSWFTTGKAQINVYTLLGKLEDEWIKQFEEEKMRILHEEQKKGEKELINQIKIQENK